MDTVWCCSISHANPPTIWGNTSWVCDECRPAKALKVMTFNIPPKKGRYKYRATHVNHNIGVLSRKNFGEFHGCFQNINWPNLRRIESLKTTKLKLTPAKDLYNYPFHFGMIFRFFSKISLADSLRSSRWVDVIPQTENRQKSLLKLLQAGNMPRIMSKQE